MTEGINFGEIISIGHITRWRSLRDLNTEGWRPKAVLITYRLTPSDITDLYHELRGHDNTSAT